MIDAIKSKIVGRPKTIGLSMIVKDEAHVICRCLESVRPLVDFAIIADTGSTDGTPETIRDYFRKSGLVGEVISEPWRDFAYNRSSALERMQQHRDIDYVLVIDADEVLSFAPDFDIAAFKAALEADSYDIEIRLGETTYFRTQLFSNRKRFRYKGVLHEFLERPADHTRAKAEGLHICSRMEGGRSRNPLKYRDDAAILERALRQETDPHLVSRYTFYLAQSYRDCGDFAKALEHYEKRIGLGFWQQEIYVSLIESARLLQKLSGSADQALACYRKAIDMCPARAEAYHGASHLLRLQGRFQEGFEIAGRALELREPPADSLFTASWVYRYGLLDEYSLNAYWSGHFEESSWACKRILALADIDGELRARIERNAEFASSALAEGGLKTAAAGDTPKVCVYAIALNEREFVDRFMRACEGADLVLVCDTGSTDGSVQRLRDLGAIVYEIAQRPWRFDDARNGALSLVPADVDICLSIDLDEVLQPGWREALNEAWRKHGGGINRFSYDYVWSWRADGTADVRFHSDKIHSRHGYRWRHPAHETLYWQGEGQERKIFVPGLSLHHHADPGKSRSQYLYLLELAVREEPDNDRMRHYYARELMFNARYEDAIREFRTHLELPAATWKEERSASWRYIARCQLSLGRKAEAQESAIRSALEWPHGREPWLEVARCAYETVDWQTCYWAAAKCLEIVQPTSSYMGSGDCWGHEPHDLAALAAYNLKMFSRALEHGIIAAKLAPEDHRLKDNLAHYRKLADH